jgi:DNA-directed RNA polymerase subunit beta'
MGWNDFLTAAVGSRKSIQDKVQEVREPGIINKHLATIMQRQVVTDEDCGTTEGWDVPVDSNLVDRYLAKPVKLPNGGSIKAGTLVTPEVLGVLKKYPNKVRHVSIHSPITCQSQGICKKAVGKINGEEPRVGHNIGIVSAQSVGERGVQLAMRSFHTAGAPSQGIMSSMGRLQQILKVPEDLPNAATLAETTGTVTKIEKDPSGGHRVWIGKEEHFVKPGLKLIAKKGQKVVKGTPISAGNINPRELLRLRGINAVRRYMYNELFNIYKDEGIKPVHIEMLVRALTSSSKVLKAPKNSPWVTGDVVKEQQLSEWNKKHPKEKVEFEPTLVSMDMMPILEEDDLLGKLGYSHIKTALQETAAGAHSNIHGSHPVHGLAYAAEFGKPPSKKEGPY